MIQFVRSPLEASSHDGIGQHAVEHADSWVQLRRGWWSLHSSLASVLTLPEALSLASSSDPHEDEAAPVGQSQIISPSDAIPEPSASESRSEGNLDPVESPRGRSTIKKWLQKRGNKNLAPDKPDRLSGKSREIADHRSPSHSPARVDDRQEGPSTMAVSVFR